MADHGGFVWRLCRTYGDIAKCGDQKIDSDVATALRTVVVLSFAWIMVFIAFRPAGTITEISAKSIIFLILSGFATGASWICYFKALSVGDVNKVVPVDKSSTVLTVSYRNHPFVQ